MPIPINIRYSSIISANAGGAGTPAAANDNITVNTAGQTSQTISVTDIISEGEIEGLVSGGASVYFDNSPVFAEGEGPTNSTETNHATGVTNSTSVTTQVALNPNILGENATNFLL